MDVRKLVWGVLLVLCGLGCTGWGAWHATVDASHWLRAHRALGEIASGDTRDLERLQRREQASGDLLGEIGAGLAALPGGRELAAATWRRREQAAGHDLLLQLPLLLGGLLLLGLGHHLLGRVSRAAAR